MGILTLTLGDEGMEKFSDEEMGNIRDFLMRRHSPVIKPEGCTAVVPPAPKRPPPPAPVPRPVTPPPSSPPRPVTPLPATSALSATATTAALTKACRTCQGEVLNVEYGKYGYYLKCRDCDGNTRIDFACTCGQKARVRKERERFFKECGSCGASTLYHVNA